MSNDPLIDVVSTTLGMAPHEVTDDLAFNAVKSWDSVNHINLMLALEEAYGIAIPDDDLVELTTVAAIRQFVARHAAPGATGPA